ncbi:MAG: cohesin domain-containing protein [Candidatus Bathyarchaeia archaeon]
MDKRLKKFSAASLIAVLMLSVAYMLPLASAQAQTRLSVDPPLVECVPKGETFTVKVNVTDVTNMYAYEFKLLYDDTVLEGISAVRPPGHFMEPSDPANQFIPVWTIKTFNATHKYWHLGFTLLAPEAPKTGSGVLVEITFKVRVSPPWHGMVQSALDLYDTKLADSGGQPIPHVAEDGLYRCFWQPPLIKPYLKVVPPTTLIPAGAPVVGTADAFFNVSVWVYDAAWDWWIVGIEFKLAYNDTLIDFKGASVDPWLDSLGDIYMTPVVKGTRWDGLAYIHLAVLLLPHHYPPATWDNPISEDGALVQLKFEVIYQEAMPWVGTSPLDIYDTKFADIAAEPVPYNPPEDGLVKIEGYVIGRAIDLYTQYPAPFGGQGFNKPSDMFTPQQQVELFALVTYNLWPVQQKDVAFQVFDPQGNLVTILCGRTNENGIAHVSFRIPWPCEDPESLFGIWTVIATVEIAEVVVNDTLQFHFDYLVRWIKVTTDKDAYAHGETITVMVEYQSYAVQERDVLLTVVAHDELNVPFDYDFLKTTVGTMDMSTWCTYKNYTATFTLTIPKFAAAGKATLYVNAYSDWPINGGAQVVPTYTPEPTIIIKPE